MDEVHWSLESSIKGRVVNLVSSLFANEGMKSKGSQRPGGHISQRKKRRSDLYFFLVKVDIQLSLYT